MRLKKSYSSREVTALTGLTARQLQWWHAHGLVAPTLAPRRTDAGGFTERRYSPVELLELAVLADLRRRGFSMQKIRVLIETLRGRFGVRLFDAIGGGGPVVLLTDGREVYARAEDGTLYNVLHAPGQPLLVVGPDKTLRELTGKVGGRKGHRQGPRQRRGRGGKGGKGGKGDRT